MFLQIKTRFGAAGRAPACPEPAAQAAADPRGLEGVPGNGESVFVQPRLDLERSGHTGGCDRHTHTLRICHLIQLCQDSLAGRTLLFMFISDVS